MFNSWSNFYLMIGGAAGALIGLLFIVSTLNTGRKGSSVSSGSSVYLTPVVFHFTMVLLVSAYTEAPRLSPILNALFLAACALVGLIYALRVSLRISRRSTPEPAHWTDFWCYGAIPTLIYASLGGAAALVFVAPGVAAYAAAAALLTLLLMSIRNAWDLVTWLTVHASPPEVD